MKCDQPDGGRKVGYSTRRDARLVAAALRRKGGGCAMKAYRCERCGAWHVGRGDLVARFDVALAGEVGERAYFHLRRETQGNRRRRAGRLVKRVGRRAA